MLLSLMWAQVTDNVSNAFLSQGVMGLIALIAIVAVFALYKDQKSSHERERQRADARELELRELHKTIQEKYMAALNDATRAVADALAQIRER